MNIATKVYAVFQQQNTEWDVIPGYQGFLEKDDYFELLPTGLETYNMVKEKGKQKLLYSEEISSDEEKQDYVVSLLREKLSETQKTYDTEKSRDTYTETESREERRSAGRRHLKKLNDLKEEMKHINEDLSAYGKKMAGYKIPLWQ